MIETAAVEQSRTIPTPVCPICSATNSKVWGVRTEHVMHECGCCGAVFFDHQEFEVHEYGNYYDYTDDWDNERVAWELRVRRHALTQQLAQLGNYVDGRRLLDIGAGPGYLCHVAAGEGWDSYGIEVSEKALRIGRRFLNVDYIAFDDVVDESFDVITCYHILEHLKHPGGFIKQVYSKLKPNGVVAVHVPHREPLSFSLRNSLRSWTNGQAEKACQLYAPEHISGFTQKSLVNAFQIFGFHPLLIKTSAMWGTYYDPFFLGNYLRENDYAGILKHTLRSLVDNLGVAFGMGDWVVGHFRKT